MHAACSFNWMYLYELWKLGLLWVVVSPFCVCICVFVFPLSICKSRPVSLAAAVWKPQGEEQKKSRDEKERLWPRIVPGTCQDKILSNTRVTTTCRPHITLHFNSMTFSLTLLIDVKWWTQCCVEPNDFKKHLSTLRFNAKPFQHSLCEIQQCTCAIFGNGGNSTRI